MNNKFLRVFELILTFLSFFLSQLCIAQGVVPGTIKWKYALDTLSSFSSVAIGRDNLIYVPVRNKLLGINPNGTLKWTFQGKPDDDLGPPSVGVDGNIYITEFNGYRPVDNGIYALNNQGLQLWTFTTNFHPADGMSSALAVGADSTIYAYGNNDDTSQSSLYAISPDGSFKWRSERAQYAPAIASTGILYSARIYGSGLIGLNPSDGEPTTLSNASIGSYWQLPSIGPNGDIYFINNYDLKAFRADGTFLWSYVHGGTFSIQPGEAVTGTNGVIYFSSYDYNQYISRVHALNPDGTLNWMYVFETGSTWAQGSPAIGNDGVIYIATGASTSGISAFNPDGSLLWQLTGFRTKIDLFNSPIIGTDGTLYVIGEEPDTQNNYHPFLYAVNISSTGPANSSWPMWGANSQHTRVVGTGGGTDTSQTPWVKPPGQRSENVTGCETPQTGRNAVVITHGYNSDAAAWVNDMAKSICSQVGGTATEPTPNQAKKICAGTQWDVWAVDWRDKATPTIEQPLPPWKVWKNAPSVGRALATTLQPCAYQHIHFIAHSAGSNVIDTATRAMGGATTIHETFLDAYDPSARSYAEVTGVNVTGNCPSQGYCDFNKDFSTYGELADWADNYVDTRQLALAASEPFDYTKLHMQAAYNVDVTPESDDCGVVNSVCIHAWPYRYYQSTIGTTTSSFGFPLSREAGQPLWAQGSMQDQYPRGTGVHISTPGWQSPPKKIKTGYVPMSGGTGGVVDQFGVAQCIVGVLTIPCSQIQLTSGASPSAARLQSQSKYAAATTAPTHEPAWLVMQVQTDQPINTLRFNWRFAAGGEGLLRAFVNEDIVSEIDQRYVPAVSSEPESTYIRDLAPGTYKIAFRLDGYGTNPSGVELTGIELGQKTLKVSR